MPRRGWVALTEEREGRIAVNEAVFRQINERLRRLNKSFATLTETMTLICECADFACAEKIEMTPSEYDQLRADPALFAVKTGHEKPEVEQVVRSGRGYDVVHKNAGLPRQVAEASDPRL
jgi:hypothetical protein